MWRADGTIRGDCPLGTIGHVLMRGPQVTPGYLDPRHDRGARCWPTAGSIPAISAGSIREAMSG